MAADEESNDDNVMLERAFRAYVRAPSHPAKMRVERILGRWVLPAEGGVFDVGRDIRLRLHSRDWIEYVLIRDSRYEPLTLDFLEANLRDGQRAMLAGVNFGLHVLVASRAVGATGLVVGVDPQITALTRTRSNLLINDAGHNVRLVPAALGAGSQVMIIDDPPDGNAGAANLRQTGRGPMCAVITRPADLWRAVCEAQPAPDLVLLDVEGFEGEVLRGFDDDFRPPILVIELLDPFLMEVGWSKARVCSQLVDMGYRLFTLDGAEACGESELPERNVVAVHARAQGPAVRFAASAEHGRPSAR